ncbi:MAG: histidine kinase [Pseudomonadota bacterium]
MSDQQHRHMTAAEVTDRKGGPFIEAPGRSRHWMNWLFADKNRMFWVLQIAGWLGFFILHVSSVSTFVAGRTPQALLYSLASSLVGFLTTSILARPIYHYARGQKAGFILLIAIPSTILMAVAMAAMKTKIFTYIFGPEWLDTRDMPFGVGNQLLLLLPDIQANLFLLGSWAGFYFGINYYLNLRNEMERVVLSARLADQAQLKMLRYQLNPHFLFNTLNAISTLVMSQDGKQADKMISQLSAFLRYSLDSDPLMKTTLAEEVRALKLYLEIEKTRFADRLQLKFDIDEDVMNAKVPSLILQPAIENAIKYAIAQMESGGKISVCARRDGDNLRMEVCDNGPEAPEDPSELLRSAKAGVGLVNMRDRLAYLYQDRCEFRLCHVDPQGLCVSLRIPYET